MSDKKPSTLFDSIRAVRDKKHDHHSAKFDYAPPPGPLNKGRTIPGIAKKPSRIRGMSAGDVEHNLNQYSPVTGKRGHTPNVD